MKKLSVVLLAVLFACSLVLAQDKSEKAKTDAPKTGAKVCCCAEAKAEKGCCKEKKECEMQTECKEMKSETKSEKKTGKP